MQTIVKIPIKNLTLLEKNPRTITSEQMSKLEKSLTDDPTFIERRPILVNFKDDKHIVYAGNQRVRAAKKLKWKEIACIVDENLDDEVMKDRVIKDNRTYGSFDFEMLANEFDIEKLLDAGFTPEELHLDLDKFSSNHDDEEIIDIPVDAKTKINDIYELDKHTVMCNNSLIANFKYDEDFICFTDPPYEMETSLIDKIFKNTNCKSFIIICSFRQAANIAVNKDYNFHFDFVVNLKIPKSFMNRKQPYYTHANGIYISTDSQTMFSCDYAKGRRSDSSSENGYWHTIIEAPRNTQAEHGHAKNVKGMCDILSGFNFKGIVDPFGGSGTTLMCAEHFNVPAIICELDPAYCDIIVQRWMKLTGKKVKRNGIEINEL